MQVCSASVFLFSTCLSSPRPSFLFKHTSRGYYLKGADQENLGKVLIPVFCFLLKKNTWDTKGRMIWFSGSLLSSQIVHWVYLLLKKCLVFGVLVLFIFQLKRHSWCFWKKTSMLILRHTPWFLQGFLLYGNESNFSRRWDSTSISVTSWLRDMLIYLKDNHAILHIMFKTTVLKVIILYSGIDSSVIQRKISMLWF